MKLYYSKFSPFARKVRATAILLSLDAQIELIPTDPYADPPVLHAANPLGLIPTLVAEDGSAFFDSPVICEYLHGIAKDLPILPQAGAARWVTLRMQALGDGLMHAAVMRRNLLNHTNADPGQPYLVRQKQAVARTLDALEAHPMNRHVDIGQVSVACALGYLDLRYADEPWREARPTLAGWFAEIADQDWFRLTAPEA